MTHTFKTGDRVRITGNSNSHCFDIGDVVTLTEAFDNGRFFLGGVRPSSLILPSDMVLADVAPWTDTNTVAWGLLTPDQQHEMQAHGGPYEMYMRDGWGKRIPDWCHNTSIYRTVPKPALTQDTIPWGVFRANVEWIARDGDGEIWWFCYRPNWNEKAKAWLVNKSDTAMGYGRLDNLLLTVIPGTCAPEDSLQMRPGMK